LRYFDRATRIPPGHNVALSTVDGGGEESSARAWGETMGINWALCRAEDESASATPGCRCHLESWLRPSVHLGSLLLKLDILGFLPWSGVLGLLL